MPDATPDLSARPRPQSNPAEEVDPFQTLHKMSTTAGLGSGDYVAINGAAVAAMLLGIASSLVLFGLALLLLVPLAGLVCAVLAFRQISGSNGTQTGRLLAGLGLLFSLGFGGIFVGRQAVESVRNRADEQQVTALIGQIESLVKAEKFTELYDLTDEHFRQRISVAQFVERFRMINNSPVVGKLSTFESKLQKFETDPVTDERVSNSMVLVSFEKVKGVDRQGMIFRKVGGTWKIDDLPSFFPQERQGGQGGAGAVPSGPAGPPAPQ